MSDWFYAKNNQQIGPISEAQFRELVQSGQLLATDLIWREGMPAWVPANQVPELAAAFPPAMPQQPSPMQQQYPMQPPYPAQSPYGQQGAYSTQSLNYGGSAPKTWLVESILCLLCCWPLAIVAIIFAAQVNGKYQAGDVMGAQQSAKTAKICVLISFGIGVAYILFYMLMMFIGMASHR